MGKVKGGLGNASLISDLTKPINFHISETLEPPPVFERRKKTSIEKIENNENELAGVILKKAGSTLNEQGNMQIIFYFEDRNEVLFLENSDNRDGTILSVKTKMGNKEEFSDVSWDDSSFSGMNIKDILDKFSSSIKGIEVISDETLLNFSSLDDFYEWLEI